MMNPYAEFDRTFVSESLEESAAIEFKILHESQILPTYLDNITTIRLLCSIAWIILLRMVVPALKSLSCIISLNPSSFSMSNLQPILLCPFVLVMKTSRIHRKSWPLDENEDKTEPITLSTHARITHLNYHVKETLMPYLSDRPISIN